MNPNYSAHLTTFETNLKTLEDQGLIEQFQKLLAREKRIGDAIMLNLQEISDRRLYAKMGYSSLFEFLVKYFHLSESAAYQRTNALKLIRDVPKAQEALFNRETSLTTMAATQSFIKKLEIEQEAPLTRAEKEIIFDSVKGKSKKEAQATFVEINPIAVLPETKEKVLTAKHTLLQVTVEQDTLVLINEIKNLLSHEIPDGHLNKILRRMAEISVGELKKKKSRSAPKEHRAPVVQNPQSENHRSSKRRVIIGRHIPTDIRRQLFKRANNCCEYVSPDGQRCQSHHQLEVDHIIPWSQGGQHSLENCRITCRNHNQYRVKETHGFWYERRME